MAGIYNFKLDQGSDTLISLTFYTDTSKTTTINVSTINFTCQLKEQPEDETFIDELTSVGGRIIMTQAASGKITLNFPGSVTKLYSFSKAYYDLYANLSTAPVREMQGIITLDKEVTK